MAQASGRRDAGELSSGDIRQSVTEKLNEAGRLLQRGRRQGAVDLYDEVLADQPDQRRGAHLPRAGRCTSSSASREEGLTSLLDAATADREYPDAAAFLAVVFYRAASIQQAANELDRLEALDPPPGHARAHRRASASRSTPILAGTTTTTTAAALSGVGVRRAAGGSGPWRGGRRPR